MHYDTTSRSRRDGEWSSLIINTIDDNPSLSDMISLQPLFFALENRKQIAKLNIETLKRLSTIIQRQYSPKMLCE